MSSNKIYDRMSQLVLKDYIGLYLAQRGPQTKRDCCAELADELEVSDAYVQTYCTANEPYWDNDCAWAIEKLRTEGLVIRHGVHGIWELTGEGYDKFIITMKR